MSTFDLHVRFGSVRKHLPDEYASFEDRQAMCRLLTDLRTYYGAYHERKENMGWAAATIYLTGLAVFASAIYGNTQYTLTWISQLIIEVLVLFTFFLGYSFIMKQHWDRSITARTISSCTEALSILADQTRPITYSWFEPTTHVNPVTNQKYIFPKIVCDRLIAQDYRNRRQVNWNLWSPIGVMFVWTIGSLVVLWFWPLSVLSWPVPIATIIWLLIVSVCEFKKVNKQDQGDNQNGKGEGVNLS